MTIATTLARTFERLRLKSLLHFRRYCAPACAHMEVSDALGHVYGTSAAGKPEVERLRFTSLATGAHAGSTAVKLTKRVKGQVITGSSGARGTREA